MSPYRTPIEGMSLSPRERQLEDLISGIQVRLDNALARVDEPGPAETAHSAAYFRAQTELSTFLISEVLFILDALRELRSLRLEG